MTPYGINPSRKDLREAKDLATLAYGDLPETTCKHRACCCKAGCPNMYFSEYMNIRDNHISKMNKEDRLDLLVQCVRYYLMPQYEEAEGKKTAVPKPCLLLDGEMCSVYQHRPLKCRTYGLVPADMHRKVVAAVAKENGIPAEDIPLCVQCPFVKVAESSRDKFPDGVIPEEMIASIEDRISRADRGLGISKKLQEMGYGFLAFHDWHIMCELGETWMANLTPMRLHKDKEWKEKFIEDLKVALRTSNENEA